MDTNYSNGKQAEQVAADYLIAQGYGIIATNWRTRLCEIDIIAIKNDCIHFVEVKYRKYISQGKGFDYITVAKQKQMAFAAELWVHTHEWNKDYSLSAVEVTGHQFEVTGFIPFLEEIS